MTVDLPTRLARARTAHAAKLARVEAADVHPDYRPDGIAPRLGHALGVLAHGDGDPHTTSAIQGLSEAILRTGDHGVLPVLADALDEAGHPLAGAFDWRHAPRGIAVDKALSDVIGRHDYRVRGRRVRALDILDVMPEWRRAMFSGRPVLSRKRALAAVRERVPDATQADVAHAGVRLHDASHIRLDAPHVAGGRVERVGPDTFHLPDRLRDSDRLMHRAYLNELGHPDASPTTYPDPRPPAKRVYARFREAVRYAKPANAAAFRDRVRGSLKSLDPVAAKSIAYHVNKFLGKDVTTISPSPAPAAKPAKSPKPKVEKPVTEWPGGVVKYGPRADKAANVAGRLVHGVGKAVKDVAADVVGGAKTLRADVTAPFAGVREGLKSAIAAFRSGLGGQKLPGKPKPTATKAAAAKPAGKPSSAPLVAYHVRHINPATGGTVKRLVWSSKGPDHVANWLWDNHGIGLDHTNPRVFREATPADIAALGGQPARTVKYAKQKSAEPPEISHFALYDRDRNEISRHDNLGEAYSAKTKHFSRRPRRGTPVRYSHDDEGEAEDERDYRPGEHISDEKGAFEPEKQPDLSEFIANKFAHDYGEADTGLSHGVGFLLSDGRGVPMGPRDQRYDDHRGAIPTHAAMKRWGWPEDVTRKYAEGTRTPALIELMRRSGAVRVHSDRHQLVLHFAAPLTPQQRRQIANHVDSNRFETVVVSPEGGKEYELQSPDSTEVERAINKAHKTLGKNKYSRRGTLVRYSHEAFAAHMADRPSDGVGPLVFADWLDEHGQPNVAAHVREHVRINKRPGWGVSSFPLSARHHVEAGEPVADAVKTVKGYVVRYHVPTAGGEIATFKSGPHTAAGAVAALRRLGDDGVPNAHETADAIGGKRPDAAKYADGQTETADPGDMDFGMFEVQGGTPDPRGPATREKHQELLHKIDRAVKRLGAAKKSDGKDVEKYAFGDGDMNKATAKRLVDAVIARRPGMSPKFNEIVPLTKAGVQRPAFTPKPRRPLGVNPATLEPGQLRAAATAVGHQAYRERRDTAGRPRLFAAYRSPAGGMVVRGTYYAGGKMVPDLQKFAEGEDEHADARKIALHNLLPDSEAFVPRPAKSPFRDPPRKRLVDRLRSAYRSKAGTAGRLASAVVSAAAPSQNDVAKFLDQRQEADRKVLVKKGKFRRLVSAARLRLARKGKPVKYSHEAFARHMVANPHDRVAPKVYADYLEERDKPIAAEMIRKYADQFGGPEVAKDYTGESEHKGLPFVNLFVGDAASDQYTLRYSVPVDKKIVSFAHDMDGDDAVRHLTALADEGHNGAEQSLNWIKRHRDNHGFAGSHPDGATRARGNEEIPEPDDDI